MAVPPGVANPVFPAPVATAAAPAPNATPSFAPPKTGLAMLGGGAPPGNSKLQSRPSMMMPIGAPPVQGKMLPIGKTGDLPMLPSGQPADNSLSSLLADAQALGLMASDGNPEPSDGSGSPRPFSMDGGTLSPVRSLSPTPGGATSPIRGLSPGRERPGDDIGENEIDIKRRQIVTEILESERKYKNYLQVLVDVRFSTSTTSLAVALIVRLIGFFCFFCFFLFAERNQPYQEEEVDECQRA
jgi:hypothetical protein